MQLSFCTLNPQYSTCSFHSDFPLVFFLLPYYCRLHSLQINVSLITHSKQQFTVFTEHSVNIQGLYIYRETKNQIIDMAQQPLDGLCRSNSTSNKHERHSPHNLSQPTGANPHLSAQHHGSQASPTTARPSSAPSPAASLISLPE